MVNQKVSQPNKTGPGFFYGYMVVAAAFIIQLAMFGPRGSFGVFFKPLETEFGWTRALISGAFSFSTIVQGFAGIIMGGLNDRLGPRIVLSLCGLLVGLGFILMSLTNAAWQLYLFYVALIGIGMGGLYTPPMSTVARWFVKRRNMMTGIVLAGGGIGNLITPPVINLIIARYSWRVSYVIMGALVLVIIVLFSQLLRRDPKQMGQTPYGENKEPEQELNSGTEGLSLRESTHTRQFWMVAVLVFCFGCCLMTVMVHIVPHVTDLGISAATAANILAATGGALLVGSLSVGAIADRIGVRQAFVICFVLMSAVLLLLLPIKEVWLLSLSSMAMALGGSGAATLESNLIAELFGLKSHGLILGVVGLSYTIGAAVGPFMAGYIFDVSGSYQLAFLGSGTLGILGIILSALIRPIKKA